MLDIPSIVGGNCKFLADDSSPSSLNLGWRTSGIYGCRADDIVDTAACVSSDVAVLAGNISRGSSADVCWRGTYRHSLGHGHGRVRVWVKEFFVERREKNIDCFRVQLLEGLELLGMEGAQGWQRWDSANQLPHRRERQSKTREFRPVDCKQRNDYKLLFFGALRPEEL